MAELRRLLIKQSRIEKSNNDSSFELLPQEVHYLTRVLRLREGDLFLITDGLGNLWEAFLKSNNRVKLNSTFKNPLQKNSLVRPLICLAVVIPKKGFNEILRMGSEIGVDVFQPLISERSIKKESGSESQSRWESILHEAIEQSERLWKPELRTTKKFNDWVMTTPPDCAFSIASPRQSNYEGFESWLANNPIQTQEIWVAIGPEGGWTTNELRLAIKHCFKGVHFGDSIMRTPTAAISATQLMASWRRMMK